MNYLAICALVGMTSARDHQKQLELYQLDTNGPEDLVALQTGIQDLHGKEWKKVHNTYGALIYDEDGDGVEDNVHYDHHTLDKFYKPNNFFPTEDLYNTRHGNLPGHIQRYWYTKQQEPESRDLITAPINNPDPTIHKATITGGFGWGL